jgi:hypothetical protein
LDTDADAATVQRLVEMSERFCVIYQTLRARLDLQLSTGPQPRPDTRSRSSPSAAGIPRRGVRLQPWDLPPGPQAEGGPRVRIPLPAGGICCEPLLRDGLWLAATAFPRFVPCRRRRPSADFPVPRRTYFQRPH